MTPVFFTVVVAPAVLAVFGFTAGLLGTRYPKLPWIATAIVVLAYVTANVVWGAWAEQCIDCSANYDSTRGNFWAGVAYLGFIATLCLIAVVWLGRFAALLFESLQWWRRT